ncbi:MULTISPECIES: ferritin-like domain-containing protein [unclassified Sphingomonas]|uniref:ferritin-like domain-containing protein n=1 Tax=unclassified Sphingomonas TaxID=196159 RepID=UPI00226B52DE|nr:MULTISPECIES: ferritin-like domain-containing protein [unclassified Sphingomonas]
MTDQHTILEMLESAGHARNARRRFLRMCGGAAAMAGTLSLLSACGDDDDDNATPAPTPTPTPTPTAAVTDIDILNFALNLEYLEGSYYSQAAFGQPVSTSLAAGTGTQGAVTGGRQVAFTDPLVAEYAREIAFDEIDHITFLRTQLAGYAVAMPAINIAGDATGAFTAAARAAGVIGATDTFDPYASDENFLLGAYLLSDVGVTAYRGSAKLITSKVFLEAAAGILATECYHDAAIRGTLYAKGLTRPVIYTNVQKISDARDSLDGTTDLDQGIGTAPSTDGSLTANIVPTDSNGIVLGRTAGQVLNIAYLNKAAVSSGGFFPAGVNGTIKTSAASG